MLVVETNDGVEGVEGYVQDVKEEADDDIVFDDEMTEFLISNNLKDIQRHLFESKLTLTHLEQMSKKNNGDAVVDDICDTEWKLKPSQKLRFKYAIASLQSKPREIEKKIVIVGDVGTGKSCILKALMGEPYRGDEGDWCSTIGVEFRTRKIAINDKITMKYEVWDTAGQERYRDLGRLHYRGAHAMFVVYDTTDKWSFGNLVGWLERIENYSRIGKVLLIGTKIDDVEHSYKISCKIANFIQFQKTTCKFPIS